MRKIIWLVGILASILITASLIIGSAQAQTLDQTVADIKEMMTKYSTLESGDRISVSINSGTDIEIRIEKFKDGNKWHTVTQSFDIRDITFAYVRVQTYDEDEIVLLHLTCGGSDLISDCVTEAHDDINPQLNYTEGVSWAENWFPPSALTYANQIKDGFIQLGQLNGVTIKEQPN